MSKGKIFAVGGAIRSSDSNPILRKFVEAAGGTEAIIIVIPSFLTRDDSIEEVAQMFQVPLEKLGAKVIICKAVDGQFPHAEYEQFASQVTGIVLGGGSQRQLMQMIGGTRFLEIILEKFNSGAPILGTSAGCAVLSKVAIMGKSDPQYADGVGLIDTVLFDQHFSSGNEEGRSPRLERFLEALHAHPGLLGVAVDENTCAVIDGKQLQVLGEDKVTIVDVSKSKLKKVAGFDDLQSIADDGIEVTFLYSQDTYTLP